MSAAGADDHDAKRADPNAAISFQTPDGDVEQVAVDQIWRIRAASTHGEPAGTTVIEYAYERIFVKDSVENVVSKVSEYRNVKKFTSPGGEPIYIVTDKITGILRPIPNEHHQNAKAIIVTREGQQQVQESRETIRGAFAK
ncbi:MAG: hypothetical protein WBP94_15105 [Rhodomicrobiaceae bacterium]